MLSMLILLWCETNCYIVQLLNRPGLVQFGDVNGDRKDDATVLMVVN
jgi:hypothetical protein